MSDEEITDGYILGSLIDEEMIDAIDFCCRKCGHSSDDHENKKCDHGTFRKCDCRHFEMDFDEVDNAKKELMRIEDLLFENYKEAKRVNDA